MLSYYAVQDSSLVVNEASLNSLDAKTGSSSLTKSALSGGTKFDLTSFRSNKQPSPSIVSVREWNPVQVNPFLL